MYEFKHLDRNSKKKNPRFPLLAKVAVLGDCTTQFIVKGLRGYAYELGYNLEIFEADYNQIDMQLLDNASEMQCFRPDYIWLCMATEKLYENFCKAPLAEREYFATKWLEKIECYWRHANKAVILQMVFPEMDDRVFGNFSGKIKLSFLYQLRKLNVMLMESSQQSGNVYLIEYPYIQNRKGREFSFSEKNYYIAKTPFSLEVIPYLVKEVLNVILAVKGKIKKCIILDLDWTLWGGVIGDDGINGIQIGELGTGSAFSEFQRWLKELKNRGIILTVCSKNDEKTAKEPFLNHPDMILHLDDISMFVANWEDKASNIKMIQETLNIGMDSIVFIDDSPFERNLVRELVSGITVPELPEDPALYLTFLKDQNYFETVSFSEADLERTEQYQAEIDRIQLQNGFASFAQYLQQLEMTADQGEFVEFYYPRIAQLTQRSNQFNLRTIRYTEGEIEEIAKDNSYITQYFCLRDRYGDYGLVSVVMMKACEKDALFIDTWLMSCRVLKRGMEEFILNRLIKLAKERGYGRVIGEYIPTAKNVMVKDIYEKFGFTKLREGCYEVICNDWKVLDTFIKGN